MKFQLKKCLKSLKLMSSNGNTLMLNKTGGYLVRTKSVNVNEGGVATGYAALDSLYLV